MESIEWEKIYEKAKGFGTGLAEFLNGLISPRLFGNLGKTIANSLNTALHFLNSFGQTFDFYEFGESIAWGIRDFFENFDFALTHSSYAHRKSSGDNFQSLTQSIAYSCSFLLGILFSIPFFIFNILFLKQRS